MPVMPTTPVTTAEQLLGLDEPEFRHELVRGELRPMSHAGFLHGVVALRIGTMIARHVAEHDLGVACAAETGFWLERNPDTVRCPDASYVAAARVPSALPRGYFDGPPDLAVEVTSPSDSYAAVHEKALFWIERGTRLVWIVEPMARLVTVYRPGGSQQTLREGDELTGGDVLPGFAIRVGDLFPS
jgi:Uma2 family endonuclease